MTGEAAAAADYPQLRLHIDGEWLAAGHRRTHTVVNPATGGATLPTMSCRVQMLRPGEKTQSHRHTSTSIYHAFRGSGTTVINGEPFHWQKGDTFIIPLWSWHEHANASGTDNAILFSMHDEPILRAFGLYREEV